MDRRSSERHPQRRRFGRRLRRRAHDRPSRHLRLRVFRAQQPRAAPHQSGQRAAAAALQPAGDRARRGPGARAAPPLTHLPLSQVIELVQAEYLAEGIEWTQIEWRDNAEVVELIDGRPHGRPGILAALSDTWRLSEAAADAHLLAELHQSFGGGGGGGGASSAAVRRSVASPLRCRGRARRRPARWRTRAPAATRGRAPPHRRRRALLHRPLRGRGALRRRRLGGEESRVGQ